MCTVCTYMCIYVCIYCIMWTWDVMTWGSTHIHITMYTISYILCIACTWCAMVCTCITWYLFSPENDHVIYTYALHVHADAQDGALCISCAEGKI